jgi:hypothetical protein
VFFNLVDTVKNAGFSPYGKCDGGQPDPNSAQAVGEYLKQMPLRYTKLFTGFRNFRLDTSCEADKKPVEVLVSSDGITATVGPDDHVTQVKTSLKASDRSVYSLRGAYTFDPVDKPKDGENPARYLRVALSRWWNDRGPSP